MSLVLPTRRPQSSAADDPGSVTVDSQTQSLSVVNQPEPCADMAASLAETTDVICPSMSSVGVPRTCGDDGGDNTQRIPDSVWSEFTETFRVIELAVSEGLRCSIDAPPPTFQPELEMSADMAPLDQYSVQLTRRDVTARRQCEYDVTCAAVARRRNGDDVRYAVSYNRWIKVARQPASVARQQAMYEAINKHEYDMNGDSEYKPKSECLYTGCAVNETSDAWMSAWPAAATAAVKQERIEDRPSCAYQFWRDDNLRPVRGARYRSAIPNEFKDCRYAAVSYNKVCYIPRQFSFFFVFLCS